MIIEGEMAAIPAKCREALAELERYFDPVVLERATLARVHEYARHFDVDDDPAMVCVAAILRTEQPPGSRPTAAT